MGGYRDRISFQDQKTKREAKRAADILGQHRLVFWAKLWKEEFLL